MIYVNNWCIKRVLCLEHSPVDMISLWPHKWSHDAQTAVIQNMMYFVRLVIILKWAFFQDSIEKSLWLLFYEEWSGDFTINALCDSRIVIIWKHWCEASVSGPYWKLLYLTITWELVKKHQYVSHYNGDFKLQSHEIR